MNAINQPVRGEVGRTRIHVFLVLSCSLALAACDREPAAPVVGDPVGSTDAEASKPETATVGAIEYNDVVELPGASVIGLESTVVVAKQAGYVKSIGRVSEEEVDIGVAVSAGTVLAELHIPELEKELQEKQSERRRSVAEVAQADAAVDVTRAMATQADQQLVEQQALRALREVELQRISKLVKMGVADLDKQDEARFRLRAAQAAEKGAQAQKVTAAAGIRKALADVEQAKAVADVAAAAVERLQVLNAYRSVVAPYDGVIVARHVDRGAFVRPAGGKADGSPLFEIARQDKVRVVAHVPPSQIGAIRPGLEARFHGIGGWPGREVRGTLSRSAKALDRTSRKMRVEMHIKNDAMAGNDPLVLGLFGTLGVTRRSWSGDNQLATVPTGAVGREPGGQAFVIVEHGGQGQRVNVEVVFDDARQVGILGDVKPGDTVRTGKLSSY